MLKKHNIIDYICNNCNLKIKNTKELVVLFHNSKGYDNKVACTCRYGCIPLYIYTIML